MLKKLLALIMSVFMISALFCAVPVSATTETVIPDALAADHVPGAVTGNVITYVSGGTDGKLYSGATNYNGYSKRAGEAADNFDVTVTTTQGTGVYLTANRDIDDPHKYWEDKDGDGIYTWDGETYSYMYPLSGGSIRRNWGSGAGKLGNVVFKFNVKLDSASTGLAIVNFGRWNVAHGSTRPGTNKYLPDIYPSEMRNEYPLEYNSKATGVYVESATEWTELAGTFMSNGSQKVDGYGGYIIGFAQGTESGAKVLFDDDAYMGIEYAYDISVTVDDEVPQNPIKIVPGETINVDADILNQVGLTGGLSQDVTWYLMNTDRTEIYTTGFEITPGSDGTAQIQIDPYTIPSGEYDVVAYSESYEMAKSIRVSVPHVVSKMTLSDFSDGTVTVSAEIANKTTTPINGVIVIIMVNDRNQIKDIVSVPVAVTSTNTKETFTEDLTATDISKVTKAKAFFIDCGSETSPTVLNSNMNEIAASVEVLK